MTWISNKIEHDARIRIELNIVLKRVKTISFDSFSRFYLMTTRLFAERQLLRNGSDTAVVQ
jgi:hypothetical protein